ncbi:hypothetical protein [Nocardioides alcanivorans]|uniref:hypothetical protein n=1 Tax=Nocardioides alcanivorans TaxID=2897352 RepID=UPI001F209430|nr:hypothetical protein [Nocardioides alcanivorans]
MPSSSPQPANTTRTQRVPLPYSAILFGALLVVAGLSIGGSGESARYGAAFVVFGSVLLMLGVIAKGVAWGLALHHQDQSSQRN